MAEAQLTNQLSRIDTMTNVELRAELKRRGCPTSGNKKDLLAKLRVALQKEYEQTALETASTTSTIDSNSLTPLQQSPVVPFDVQRRQMVNSPAATQYVNYQQPMHNAEAPLTYHNLQIHDQVRRKMSKEEKQRFSSVAFVGRWTISSRLQFDDATTGGSTDDSRSSTIDVVTGGTADQSDDDASKSNECRRSANDTGEENAFAQ